MEKKKAKFDRNKYNAEYTASHYVVRGFRFKPEEDKDVLDKLDEQKNKSQYIKRLIREDLERSNNKQ